MLKFLSESLEIKTNEGPRVEKGSAKGGPGFEALKYMKKHLKSSSSEALT